MRPKPGNFNAGMRKSSPATSPSRFELDALDPAELEAGKTVQIELDAGAAVGQAGVEAVAEIAADRVRRQR